MNSSISKSRQHDPPTTIQVVPVSKREQNELQVALDMCSEAVFIMTPVGLRLVEVNQRACESLGYTRDELLTLGMFDLTPKAHRNRLSEATERIHCDGYPPDAHYTVQRHKNGAEIAARIQFRHVEAKTNRQIIGVVRTAAQEHGFAQLSETAVQRDALTGLPDRLVFVNRLTLAMDHATRVDTCHAVFFIDLNGFKRVNDTFGHLAGDRVLCTVSQRIVANTRHRDLVARFGGDEFLVLMEHIDSRRQVINAARRLTRVIRSPIRFKQSQVIVSASIGIAYTSAQRQETVDEIVHRSDRAMYRAKGSPWDRSWVIDEFEDFSRTRGPRVPLIP